MIWLIDASIMNIHEHLARNHEELHMPNKLSLVFLPALHQFLIFVSKILCQRSKGLALRTRDPVPENHLAHPGPTGPWTLAPIGIPMVLVSGSDQFHVQQVLLVQVVFTPLASPAKPKTKDLGASS